MISTESIDTLSAAISIVSGTINDLEYVQKEMEKVPFEKRSDPDAVVHVRLGLDNLRDAYTNLMRARDSQECFFGTIPKEVPKTIFGDF